MNKGRKLLFKETLNFVIKYQCRSYLSQAYYCDDIWRNRLDDPLIMDIKPVNFYYEIIQNYKKHEGKISSIDVDLFMNSIRSSGKEKLTEEIEEVLRLLRRSKETINTLYSTPHAVLRHLFKIEETDLILKMLSDPTNYGVFPCYYLTNLLMDHFLKKKNYTACARVASTLMLQEDYGPPLTQALALCSGLHYILNQDSSDPWLDYNPFIEPEEEVKVVVPYIRNFYFDDHFDLKNPKHIVGKLFAWMSPHIEDDSLRSNFEILGWGLYQKWSNLDEALNRLKDTANVIDKVVVSLVSKELEDCTDLELKKSIENHFSNLKTNSRISDIKLQEFVETFVKESAEKYEKFDIEQQISIYNSWQGVRHDAREKHLEDLEREGLILQIKDKKKYLREKEDVLFFFDNKLKLEMKYAELKQNVEETEEEDDEYIPPEIRPKNY